MANAREREREREGAKEVILAGRARVLVQCASLARTNLFCSGKQEKKITKVVIVRVCLCVQVCVIKESKEKKRKYTLPEVN